MKHGPGTVITPCGDTARYTWFQVALNALETPPGSRWMAAIGLNPVDNLNSAIRGLRDEDEWIWMIGDDHVFGADVLMRLLDRELDVVVPLCSARQPPWPLMHFTRPDSYLEGYFEYLQYDEIPDDEEPFELERTGSAMLVRRHVLDAIGDPWFGTDDSYRLNEDMNFCERVIDAGFKIYADPTVAIGHIGQTIYTPVRKNGVWGLEMMHMGPAATRQFLPGGMNELANLGEIGAAV